MTDQRLTVPKMPEDYVRSLTQKPRTYHCLSVVRWYNGTMAITVLKLKPFGFLPGFTSVVWVQRMETGGMYINRQLCFNGSPSVVLIQHHGFFIGTQTRSLTLVRGG